MNDSSLYNDNSSICLDGTEVKRLRESQGLTQLYVSKVVGVTTDTISRWENNRYPTIRRDNALKLADALDVSLDKLLRKPAETVPAEPFADNRRRYLIAGVVLLLVVLGVVLFVSRRTVLPPPVTVSAERLLPAHAAPGTAIPVRIELTRQPGNDGFILRENFPKGWKLLQASPPAASLDNVNGVARWIIKSAESLERIVYLVQVGTSAETAVEGAFLGEIVVGGGRSQSQLPIAGATDVAVAAIHWADDNGDGRIDDAEMLKASFVIADMAGVHIDWNRLERLWDAGRYQWDAGKGEFIPLAAALPAGNSD
ncbi:MAG: helix-turn-helix transcriptional regulator [Desulfuromonadales bacterium]|nr:helix-turn-helix transcriptional regulator [Desulfuromonadales bacterium]